MRGSGGIPPIILSICIIWRRVISFTLLAVLAPSKETRSSSNRSRSESLKEEKNPLLLAGIEPRFLCRPLCSQVPKRAELSRIFIFYINISNKISNTYNDNQMQGYIHILPHEKAIPYQNFHIYLK